MDFNKIIDTVKNLLGKIDFGAIIEKAKPILAKIGDFLKKTPSIFAAIVLLCTLLFDPAAGSTESSQLIGEDVVVLMDAANMGQGITNDGTYYYTSGSMVGIGFARIAKYDIETLKKVDENKKPLPDELKKRGNDHIGDISYYDGKIYAAVEDSDAFLYPCVAVYDAASLDFITYYDISPTRFPSGIPWLAVDGLTGNLYASTWSNAEVISMFQISATMAHVKDIEINGLDGLNRIQGGEFYNGTLYLSCDNKDGTTLRDVIKVNVDNGFAQVAFTRDVGKADSEAEGLTIFPGKDGSLFHVLDYNKIISVYIRHYATKL